MPQVLFFTKKRFHETSKAAIRSKKDNKDVEKQGQFHHTSDDCCLFLMSELK